MKSENFRYVMNLDYDWKYEDESPVLTVKISTRKKSRKKPISDKEAVEEITTFLTSEDNWGVFSYEVGNNEVSLQADDVNGDESFAHKSALDAIAGFLKKHPKTRRFKVTGYMA
jgi:hypothetical protein